jgi:hypothetical protein
VRTPGGAAVAGGEPFGVHEGRLPRWELLLRLVSTGVVAACVIVVGTNWRTDDDAGSRPAPTPAVLAAERTRDEVSGSIPPPSDHTPTCIGGQLIVRDVDSVADPSESTTTITFENTGDACALYGRPQLSFIGPDGVSAVPVQVNRAARPPERVVLAGLAGPAERRRAVVRFGFDVEHSELWRSLIRPVARVEVRLPGTADPVSVAVPGDDGRTPLEVPAAVEVPPVA